MRDRVSETGILIHYFVLKSMSAYSNQPIKGSSTSVYLNRLIEKNICNESGSFVDTERHPHLPFLEGEEHAPFYKITTLIKCLVQNALETSFFRLLDLDYIGGSLLKDLPKSYYDRCDAALGVESLPSRLHDLIQQPKNDIDLRVWLSPKTVMTREQCVGAMRNLRIYTQKLLGKSCQEAFEVFENGNMFILLKIVGGEHPIDLAFVVKLKRASLFCLDDFCLSLLPYFNSFKPENIAPMGVKKSGWQAYIDRRERILRISKVGEVERGWIPYVSHLSSGYIPKKDYSAILIENEKNPSAQTKTFRSFFRLVSDDIFNRIRSHKHTSFEQQHLAINTVLMSRNDLNDSEIPLIFHDLIAFWGASTDAKGILETIIQLLNSQTISPKECVALFTLAALLHLSFQPCQEHPPIFNVSLHLNAQKVLHFKIDLLLEDSSRSFYFPFQPQKILSDINETTFERAERLLPFLFSSEHGPLSEAGTSMGCTQFGEDYTPIATLIENLCKSEKSAVRKIGNSLLKLVIVDKKDSKMIALLFDIHDRNADIGEFLDETLFKAYQLRNFHRFIGTNPPLLVLIKELKRKYWELDPTLLFETISRIPEQTPKSLKALQKLAKTDESLSEPYLQVFMSVAQRALDQKNTVETQTVLYSKKTIPKICSSEKLWSLRIAAIQQNPSAFSYSQFNQGLLVLLEKGKQEKILIDIIQKYLLANSEISEDTIQILSGAIPLLFDFLAKNKNYHSIVKLWNILNKNKLAHIAPVSILASAFEALLEQKLSKEQFAQIDPIARALFPQIPVLPYINMLIKSQLFDLANVWIEILVNESEAVSFASLQKLHTFMKKCVWDDKKKSLAMQKLLHTHMKAQVNDNTEQLIPFLQVLFKGELCTSVIQLSLQILTAAPENKGTKATLEILLKLLPIVGPEQKVTVLQLFRKHHPNNDPFGNNPNGVIEAVRTWLKIDPKALLTYLNITENNRSPLYQHLLEHTPILMKKLIAAAPSPLKFTMIRDFCRTRPQDIDRAWFEELLAQENYPLAAELVEHFPVENSIRERRALIPHLPLSDALQQIGKIMDSLGVKTSEEVELLKTVLENHHPHSIGAENIQLLLLLLRRLEPPYSHLWEIFFENLPSTYLPHMIQGLWILYQIQFPPSAVNDSNSSVYLPILERYVDQDYIDPITALCELVDCRQPITTEREVRIFIKILTILPPNEKTVTTISDYMTGIAQEISHGHFLRILSLLLDWNNPSLDKLLVETAYIRMKAEESPQIIQDYLAVLNRAKQLLPTDEMLGIYTHPKITVDAHIARIRVQCQQLHYHRRINVPQTGLIDALEVCIDSMANLRLFENKELTEYLFTELLFLIDSTRYDPKQAPEFIKAVIGMMKTDVQFNLSSLENFATQLLDFLIPRGNSTHKPGTKMLIIVLKLLFDPKRKFTIRNHLNFVLRISSLDTGNANYNEELRLICTNQLRLLITHKKLLVKSSTFLKTLFAARDYEKIKQYFPVATPTLVLEFKDYVDKLPFSKGLFWYNTMYFFQTNQLINNVELIVKIYINRIDFLLESENTYPVLSNSLIIIAGGIKRLQYVSPDAVKSLFSALEKACYHYEQQDYFIPTEDTFVYLKDMLSITVKCIKEVNRSVELLLCDMLYFNTVQSMFYRIKTFTERHKDKYQNEIEKLWNEFRLLVFAEHEAPLTIAQKQSYEQTKTLFLLYRSKKQLDENPVSAASSSNALD